MKLLELIFGEQLEKSSVVRDLIKAVEVQSSALNFYRGQSERMERENTHLRNIAALAKGTDILKRAEQELTIGLTDTLQDVLDNVRSQIKLHHRSDVHVASPDMSTAFDFRVEVPPISIRYGYLVSRREMERHLQDIPKS